MTPAELETYLRGELDAFPGRAATTKRSSLTNSRQDFPVCIPFLHKGNVMMVGHHKGHTEPVPVGDLLRGRNPVVTGDHCVHAVLIRLIDQVLVNTVAVGDPVRNPVVHIGAAPFQPLI